MKIMKSLKKSLKTPECDGKYILKDVLYDFASALRNVLYDELIEHNPNEGIFKAYIKKVFKEEQKGKYWFLPIDIVFYSEEQFDEEKFGPWECDLNTMALKVNATNNGALRKCTVKLYKYINEQYDGLDLDYFNDAFSIIGNFSISEIELEEGTDKVNPKKVSLKIKLKK